MTIKKEIKQYLSNSTNGTAGYDATLLDPNHFARRMFRCWLDGSYKGYQHYVSNCTQIKVWHDDSRAMRNFVIWEFGEFLAHEFGCSAGYAKQCVVDTVDRETLELLNVELIDDAIDLIRDEIEEVA